MVRPSAAFIALLSIGWPLCSAAIDRFVSKEGSDSNPGAFASPYLTIQHAMNQSAPGDVIHVRGVTTSNAQAVYGERLLITGLSGTAAQPITVRNYAGNPMRPAIDGASIAPESFLPNNTRTGLIDVRNQSHWAFIGLEVRNYKTSSAVAIPCGIHLEGACQNVRLQNLNIHDIWQSNTGSGGNGFGIAAYGDAATAIDGLVIDGCEIHNLRTGWSECVALNGNVTNFQVTSNIVRDCNNIGIDFIGYESTNTNPSLDRARDGICSGNTVFNIDSQFNPAYGGNFTGTFPNQDARNNTRSAPGIYVDGGTNIVIERNTVYQCNFGISIGSEHLGKTSDNVKCRNNLIRHNHVGGIVLGGSGTGNGGATGASITHNTLYQNDTELYGGGCVSIQHHVSTTAIQQNIMFAKVDGSGWGQFVLKDNTDGSFAANAINWNIYSGTSAGNNLEFIWAAIPRSTFNGWKTNSGQDSSSIFTTASLGFTNAAANDFTLTSSSPAKDAADPAFAAALGEKDHGGQSRIAGGRADIGADEHMTAWQAWRDQHFALPDGGTNANAGDDYDQDGAKNLLEYSQGMNPTASDLHLLPFAILHSAGTGRFTYRKIAPELLYKVRKSHNLSSWSDVTTTETNAGGGLFYRDSPLDGPQVFFQLQIEQP